MPEPTLPIISNAAYKRLVEAAMNADVHNLKGQVFFERFNVKIHNLR
jgi:hypothetical protein